MATWNSRGLRGQALEEMLRVTNDRYRKSGLGLIQKIPTPITPIEMDKTTRHITLAYFEEKSTVDYIGAVQGIPVCFDAKECAEKSFPMHNVHAHQVAFMKEYEEQGGIAFILLYFTELDEMYYVPFQDINRFYQRAQEGGRKSAAYEEIDKSYRVSVTGGVFIHYLDQLQRDLASRRNREER